MFEGCDHPDLRLLAYGGRLFDPERFPVLEDARFTVGNGTMYEMLRQLLFAWGKVGGERMRQRVSYRTLDVEQIGYVYEGLLDHRIGRAGDDAILRLSGEKEPEVTLAELSVLTGPKQIELLAKRMDKDAEWVTKKLAEAAAQDQPRNLPVGLDPKIAAAARPFDALLRKGGVVEPHQRFVTLGLSRRISGSHYTPQTLTAGIVRHTLEPLVYRNEHGVYELVGGRKLLKTARELLDLKVCDMAMGSGAFLVQAVRYLADRLVEAWEIARQSQPEGVCLSLPYAELCADPRAERLIPDNIDEQRVWAKRYVAERCIYGVDKNHLAVEMAKLSLWLTTLAKDRAFTFLDHALKCGDSLVGVDCEQLETWSFDRRGDRQGELFLLPFRRSLDLALRLRRELVAKPVLRASEIKQKEEELKKAEQALALVKLGADLLVASHLGRSRPRDRDNVRAHHLDRYNVLLTIAQEQWAERSAKLAHDVLTGEMAELRRYADGLLADERPFHWPFEFPEVFLDHGRRGFDAFVGNPPFMGGQKITGNFGVPYRDWLVDVVAEGRRGSADLCAYFYLADYSRLQEGSCMGLIATNTIGQGDTLDVGLAQLEESQSPSIYRAISEIPWPGKAGVHVSVVHIYRGLWEEKRNLDGKEVDYISPRLDASRSWRSPRRIRQNEGKSFQGSIVLGLGFTIEPGEAQRLIDVNPRNAEVLFPYLNGDDLNNHPEQKPSRWVINFRDWPLEKCEEIWPELTLRLRMLVKPERDGNTYSVWAREHWWLYERPRLELHAVIEGTERVLVCSEVSKYLGFVWLPTKAVFSANLDVFPGVEDAHFSVMQSHVHEIWARRYSSSLKSDTKYSPGNAFETFAFPQNMSSNQKELLDNNGETYHRHRRQLMKDRWIGFTNAFNLFHDPACEDADIAKLRALQVEMDNAVLAAYGWTDIDLGHAFRDAPWLKYENKMRYTITPEAREQIIERLLALNHEIAEREAIAARAKPNKTARRGTRKTGTKARTGAHKDFFG